jgi:hypothetical protein
MSSEFMEAYRDEMKESLEAAIDDLDSPSATFSALCDASEAYRVVAIYDLLLDANAAGFHANLCKSSQLFRSGLDRIDATSVIVSRAKALFDAIACGDRALATNLARLLPSVWHTGREYEEDFLYVRFIVDHFLLSSSREHDEATVARMEAVLEGATDVRLDLCRAFLDRDQEAFGSAFTEFLDDYAQQSTHLVQRGRLMDELACSLPHVCVEGLALLRFAEDCSFEVEQEYPLIPSLVRDLPAELPAADAWCRPWE